MRTSICQSAGSDDGDFSRSRGLRRTYFQKPKAEPPKRRAEILRRAKELVNNASYPGPEIIRKTSHLLAGKMTSDNNPFLPRSGQPRAASLTRTKGLLPSFGSLDGSLLLSFSICSGVFLQLDLGFYLIFLTSENYSNN